ncbi:MAG: SPOR domain-containing protein [bacterium]
MFKYYFCLPLLLVFFLFACRSKESGEKEPVASESIQLSDTTKVQAEADSLAEVQKRVKQEPIQIVETEAGRYTVQVSSWRKRKNAERDAQRFINQGYDAYIQKAYLADRNETWFRVRIGQFASRDEGRQLATQLAELLESGYWLDKYRAEK